MGPVALPPPRSPGGRKADLVAVGRQVSGLLALLFASVAGFQLGRHISLWMTAREAGGVIPGDAAAMALPLAIVSFAAAAASRSQSVRAITAVVLIMFATIGMVTERMGRPAAASASRPSDAGN